MSPPTSSARLAVWSRATRHEVLGPRPAVAVTVTGMVAMPRACMKYVFTFFVIVTVMVLVVVFGVAVTVVPFTPFLNPFHVVVLLAAFVAHVLPFPVGSSSMAPATAA